MRFLHILAASAALLAAPVSAQNLLINGDFEASGDIGFGNHLYYHITGWESASMRGAEVAWNRANLVQVDGPGGGDYSTDGPESDADAAPAGTPMHYVDDYRVGTDMIVWQYFTPTCSGMVQGSAAFSNRGNNYVPLSLGIVGPITNLLAPPTRSSSAFEAGAPAQDFLAFVAQYDAAAATASIPSLTTRTYPWATRATNSTPVVAGQTYAFAARYGDNGNIDNASVTYVGDPICGDQTLDVSPLTPRDISVTKSCQALEAGVHNGVLGQIWHCSVAVTVPQAPFAGVLTVADLFTPPAGGSGQIIASGSQSGSFDCAAGVSCTIDGADFDVSGSETLSFDVFTSGTSFSGTLQMMNCATGSYDVEDTSSLIRGNCVAASWTPSSDVVKTCEPVVATESGVMSLACQITVTGSNLPAGSYVSLFDMFAAQPPAIATVVGPMTNISSSEPWSCLDAPSNGAATLGICQLSTLDLFNAGGSSTIDMTFDFTTDLAPTQVANCPMVGIVDQLVTGGEGPDGGARAAEGEWPAGLPDGCVFIDVPEFDVDPPLPALEQAEVSKICETPQAGQVAGVAGFIWECEISLVLNPAPFAGSFTLTEDASQITNASASFVSSSLPCTGISTDTLICAIDGATASSPQTLSVQMFATPIDASQSIEWTNCVSGDSAGSSNPIVAERACVNTTIKPDDTPLVPVVDVTKTCEPTAERQVMGPLIWFQQMRCALTVTTNGVPFTGPLWLTEELIYGPNNMNSSIAALSSVDPWQCAQPPFMAPGQGQGSVPYCAITGAQFPHAAGTSTVYVDFTLYGGLASLTGATNCVGVTLGEMPAATPAAAQASDCAVILPAPETLDPELSITKTCEPAEQVSPGAWHVDCAVTISGSNLPAGETVRVVDEITSSALQTVSQGVFLPPASLGPNCGGYAVPNGIGGACDLSTDFITAQGGSVTIPYSAEFTGQPGLPLGSPPAQNCAFADLTDPSLHAPAGPLDRVCVPIQFNASAVIDPDLPDIAEPSGPTRPVITDGGTIGSVGDPFVVDPVDPTGPVIIDGGSIGSVGGPFLPDPSGPDGPPDGPIVLDDEASVDTGSIYVGTPGIDISKSCTEVVLLAMHREAQCQVTITGNNLLGGQTLRLVDTLTSSDPNIVSVLQSSGMPVGATCFNNVVPNGRELTCDIPTDAVMAQGGILVLPFTARYHHSITTADGVADGRNCVSLELVGTSLRAPAGAGAQACVPLEVREPRWTYSKSCEPLVYAAGAQSAQMQCTMTVSGQNLTSANSLHLMDQLGIAPSGAPTVPIIGSFTNVTGANGWNCYNHGNWSSAGICSVTGDVLNAAGGSMTFDWTAEVGLLAEGLTLQNCIDVRLDSLNNMDNAPLVCAQIPVSREPAVAGGVAALMATPDEIGSCRADRDRQVYDCAVGVTVENTGPRAFTGPVALLETFGAPGINAAQMISDGDVECGGAVANAVTCAFPSMTWQPRDVHRVDLSLVVPGRRGGGQVEVCAALGAPETPRQRVAMVQNMLNQRGLDAGPVDGLPGRRTYAALAQVQRQLGLPQSRDFDAELMASLGLAPASEQSCTQLSLPPMPAPPLQCNAATTITRGDRCACRYDGMTRRNATSCACPRGTELVRGEGCRRIAAPAPPDDHDQGPAADCRSGLTLNGVCVELGGSILQNLIPGLQPGE